MPRVLGGAALAVPVLLILWFAPPVAFLWLTFLFALRTGWEFQGLATSSGWHSRRWDGALDAGAFVLAAWVGGTLAGLVLTLVALRLLVRALGAASPKEGLASAGVLLLGVLWIGGSGSLIALTRGLPGGREAVLLLLAVVAANDIAAYYVGRRFGRRPLAPVISAAKTIEGAVGGLVFSGVVGGAVAAAVSVPGLGPVSGVAAGLALSVFTQLGDLCESLLKRAAGEKDAADLIPGHGGLFDRIDGLLLAAPPFYYFLLWTQAG